MKLYILTCFIDRNRFFEKTDRVIIGVYDSEEKAEKAMNEQYGWAIDDWQYNFDIEERELNNTELNMLEEYI